MVNHRWLLLRKERCKGNDDTERKAENAHSDCAGERQEIGRVEKERWKGGMKKDREEFDRCMEMVNQAKDRLAEVSERLNEAGYVRKSKSAMNLVYLIEEWQNRN